MRATPKKTQTEEILYGVHPIIECLKAGKRRILAIYMAKPEPKGWDRIKEGDSMNELPVLKRCVRPVLESWGLLCWSAALSAFDGWRDPSRCAAPIVGSRF